MHTCYKDILALTDRSPIWFDENAVPRFCEFTPDDVAGFYAEEVVLMLIECQSCRHQFQVAMSWDKTDHANRFLLCKNNPSILEFVPFSADVQGLHYGDPPNIGCCDTGLSMNSIPKKVLQFWQSNKDYKSGQRWLRREDLEVNIVCGWDEEE